MRLSGASETTTRPGSPQDPVPLGTQAFSVSSEQDSVPTREVGLTFLSHQTAGVLIWRNDSRSISRCGGGPSGGGSWSDRCGARGGAPGGPCVEASTGAPVLRQWTGRATGFSLS